MQAASRGGDSSSRTSPDSTSRGESTQSDDDASPREAAPEPMFEQVVVGIRDDHAGRDAIALAMELVSGDGAVTLLHVQVISARPAPDSGAVGAAAKYRYAIERLTTLANECAIAARVSCVEAPLATRRAARGTPRANTPTCLSLAPAAAMRWEGCYSATTRARCSRTRMRDGDRSRRIRLPHRQHQSDRRRLRPLG